MEDVIRQSIMEHMSFRRMKVARLVGLVMKDVGEGVADIEVCRVVEMMAAEEQLAAFGDISDMRASEVCLPHIPVTSERLPEIRGRYIEGMALSKVTWFRVGGPADVVFQPADEDDLAHFLKHLDADIPVMVIGVGSNVLVRDGGVAGVVIRLGGAFAKIEIEGERVRAGAAALDASVAKKAGAMGIAGLEFLRGIPGAIGGALRMNAGAYGGEVKDVLVEAIAYDRSGTRHVFDNAAMGFTYRHCGLPDDLVFVSATFKGTKGDSTEIEARMAEIMVRREASQPIKERTGGSTFKNPDPSLSGGRGSWQLIDAAGGRGLVVGDAQCSEQHCNFLINRGNAKAIDLEVLGERLRQMVREDSGVELQWEIKRVGCEA